MKKLTALSLFLFGLHTASSQVIDVHMHSYTSDDYWGGQSLNGVESPNAVDLHLKQTIDQMNKYNIKFSILSGSIKSVEKYVKADSRFIPGYADTEQLIPITEFEQLIKDGKLKVFGEVAGVYYGRTLNDSIYAPYLKVCEKYNIPVAYHTGGGPPMTPYNCCPKFRISLGDPFLIEDVLIRYPKLQVYLMHGGENFFENTVRMMKMYTHLYIDLGVLLWVDPFVNEYAIRLLKLAKQANVLDRVMFGSDQMVWPGAISKSVEFLNSQPFLTDQEKKMILYDNAKVFFKLK
jgi:predicted TIM-barrel fold metal-dependent hydrolase